MEEDGYELFDTAHMGVTERLIACLRNETMTDVALVGDDGVPVPAARYILGSASAAFQPLLYGQMNRDGNSSTVNISEANQKSLTALVEFCCSDELNTSIWAESHPLEIVQDTVALAKLAHTYGVPKLQYKVKEFLNPLMLAYPPLACSVFNLADPVATPDVYAASLVILQEKAYVALKSSRKETAGGGKPTTSTGGVPVPVGGMICFSPTKLEDVLSDNEIEADELFLFQQLVAWRDHNDYKYNNVNGICKNLVHHLDLSSIDPNAIETTVMQSGFVTSDMLVKALMAQAKSATHEGLAFASLRGPRGKKFAHVLVQGAGDNNCNGVYVHVKREKIINKGHQPNTAGRNLLYFIKKPSASTSTTTTTPTSANQPKLPPSSSSSFPPKTYILVQDSMGTWRICDSEKFILYECRDGHTIGTAEIPHTGWSRVTGALPAPECSWLRPHSSSNSNSIPPSPSRSIGSDSCSTVEFPLPTTSPQRGAAPLPKPSAAEVKQQNAVAPKPPTPVVGGISHHSFLTASSSAGGHSQNSLDFQLSEEDDDVEDVVVPQVPQSSRNEKVKQVMEYDKAGLVAAAAKKATPTGKNNAVMEEKKEAPEDSSTAKIAEKNTVDGPPLLNRKTNSNKEKRKMARKSSLVDDESDDIGGSTMDPNDPILGTTIGGDGFLSADNKKDLSEAVAASQGSPSMKLSKDLLKMFDRAAAPTTPTSNKTPTENPQQSSPSGCILPNSNGEPVLVDCSSALKAAYV